MADATGDKRRDGSVSDNASPQFVHLRVHSAYSLLEGALPVKKIVGKARERRSAGDRASPTPTICSARSNLPRRRSKEGVQPIIGCQLSIDMGDEAERRASAATQQQLRRAAGDRADRRHEAGYRNLVRLVSRAYLGTARATGRSASALSWLAEVGRRHDLPDRRAAAGRSAWR